MLVDMLIRAMLMRHAAYAADMLPYTDRRARARVKIGVSR